MKNILHIILPLLLTLTHIPTVLTQSNQQRPWHKPLTKLYHNDRRIKKQSTIQTIKNFQKLPINNLSDIKKNKLSKNTHEHKILKLYYIFTKIDNNKSLTKQETKEAYKTLTKLYHKPTKPKKIKYPNIQKVTENFLTETTQQTNIRKLLNTNPKTKNQKYTLQLARLLNKHITYTQSPPSPIIQNTILDYSDVNINLGNQFGKLKTTLINSPSNIVLKQMGLNTPPVYESSSDEESDDSIIIDNFYSPVKRFTDERTIKHIHNTSQELKKKIRVGAKQVKDLEQLTPSKLDIIFEEKQPSPKHKKKRKTHLLSTEEFHNQVKQTVNKRTQPQHLEEQGQLNTINDNTTIQDLKKQVIELKEEKQQLQITQLQERNRQLETIKQTLLLHDVTIQNLNTQIIQLQQLTQTNTLSIPTTHILAALLGVGITLTISQLRKKTSYKARKKATNAIN